MTKKLHITHFIVVLAMAFALLFQSFHSVKHLSQILTEKVCLHDPSYSKTTITHHHHGVEKCTLCDFTFSSAFTFNKIKNKSFQTILFYNNSYYYQSPEIYFFSGSTFAQRGPPAA